ncbi:MAG: endonuclease/exonuclease/phosphatase family protein [bacterium]
MNKLTLFLFISLHAFMSAHAMEHDRTLFTEKYARADSSRRPGQNVRVIFWNVENLYDSHDDTLTLDEEFSPEGSKRWSYTRYRTKLDHLAKVILAAGGWDPPGIVGLCEIENRYVLNKLVYDSPLKPLGYRIIHRDSPDLRGVDVALLYRKETFIPLHQEWIRIRFPFDTAVRTREILYVKGILLNADTLHLFVNHWPSRMGGEMQSAPRRNYVAQVLREKVDSIMLNYELRIKNYELTDTRYQSPVTSHQSPVTHQYPSILIMGDFNDEPENESLRTILQAKLDTMKIHPSGLVNLMGTIQGMEGSHKYREHWGMLDQFIVSGSLLQQDNSLHVNPAGTTIFRPAFLLEDDLKYLDKKPKRTYLGPKYQGGFSDHLPIYVDIKVNGKQ